MGRGPIDFARRTDRLDLHLPALRSLVDARELGKALHVVCDPKGFLARHVEDFEPNPDDSARIANSRVMLDLAGIALADLTTTVGATALAGTPITERALRAVRRAQTVYAGIAAMDRELLLEFGILAEIACLTIRLARAGWALIEQADQYRRVLDDSYARG